MKLIKVFIYIIVFIGIAFSQNNNFEINAGINNSWLKFDSDQNEAYENEFRVFPSLGINYKFIEVFNSSISLGVRYFKYEKNIRMDWRYISNSNHITTEKLDQSFITIPLQIKYMSLLEDLNILLNFEVAFLVNSSGEGYYKHIYKNMFDINNFNKINYLIGIGTEFMFRAKKNLFSIRSILNYSLNDVPKSPSRYLYFHNYRILDFTLSLCYYL